MSYHDLEVWQTADAFAGALDRIAEKFPPREQLGMTAQLRGAGRAIAELVAQAHGQQEEKRHMHCVNEALGLFAEAEALLDFSFRLGYVTLEEHKELSALKARLGKQLWAFYKGK